MLMENKYVFVFKSSGVLAAATTVFARGWRSHSGDQCQIISEEDETCPLHIEMQSPLVIGQVQVHC